MSHVHEISVVLSPRFWAEGQQWSDMMSTAVLKSPWQAVVPEISVPVSTSDESCACSLQEAPRIDQHDGY